MPYLAHTTMDSPIGPLTLVAADGALTGVYMDRQRYRPGPETFGDRDHSPFAPAIAQLEDYFAGRRTEFDLPLAFVGTPFQRLVWEALRKVPYGQTVSYGQLADRLGRPAAALAVGCASCDNVPAVPAAGLGGAAYGPVRAVRVVRAARGPARPAGRRACRGPGQRPQPGQHPRAQPPRRRRERRPDRLRRRAGAQAATARQKAEQRPEGRQRAVVHAPG